MKLAGIDTLSCVIESPWDLSPGGLTSKPFGKNSRDASIRFSYRHVFSNPADDAQYTELDTTDQVNREVFRSLVETEQQLLQEYNDAVIVFRIVYAAKQGSIINFDRKQNWTRMVKELEGLYSENLDNSITAEQVSRASAEWRSTYDGTNQAMPENMKLK